MLILEKTIFKKLKFDFLFFQKKTDFLIFRKYKQEKRKKKHVVGPIPTPSLGVRNLIRTDQGGV
jgi:hypothetical protein